MPSCPTCGLPPPCWAPRCAEEASERAKKKPRAGYVELSADVLLAFLAAKGFYEAPHRGKSEIVYERAHEHETRFKVIVYTSIRRGAKLARSKGKDAIRVCAIFDDGPRTYGVAKLPRVHRTGTVEGVLERVLERAREAYAACNREIARRRSLDALARPVSSKGK